MKHYDVSASLFNFIIFYFGFYKYFFFEKIEEMMKVLDSTLEVVWFLCLMAYQPL